MACAYACREAQMTLVWNGAHQSWIHRSWATEAMVNTAPFSQDIFCVLYSYSQKRTQTEELKLIELL